MPKVLPWSSDHTLLCERCGYILDGFSPATPCPECGTPIANSLPSARPGTAWQQQPSVINWLRTNWAVLRHPMRTFRQMRPVADRRAWLLVWINLTLASVLPGIMWVAVTRLISSPTMSVWYMRVTPPTNGGLAVMYDVMTVPRPLSAAILCIPALLLALLLLTWIETVGVRFFGRKRAWRITWPIALAVCAHCSVGWIIGGLLHALIPLARSPLWFLLDQLPPPSAINVALGFLRLAPILTIFVGMLVFETLVYLGIRECRYANAQPDQPPTMPPTLPAHSHH